jgi:soluble lytic murein transglycosylase-like protein
MDPTSNESLRKAVAACALAVAALFAQAAARNVTAEAPAVAPIEMKVPDPKREALVDYLSEKYGREGETTGAIVDEAYAAGHALNMDPLLVLAIVAVESRFDPAARNKSGAKGLMQVIPRFHRDKLAEHGGEAAVLDPRVNLLVGTKILRDYVRQTGSLHAGLQRYAGWQDDEERRYARKVITEKERLRRVVRAAVRTAESDRRSS